MLCLLFCKQGLVGAHGNLMSREWVVIPIRTSVMVTVPLPCPARPEAWHPSQLDVLRVGGSREAEEAPREGQRM